MTAPARQTPITGEELDALWAEHLVEWALEDLARVDPRPLVATRRSPAACRAEEIQKAPQARASVVQPQPRLTYQERMARLEALVGPMRAMAVPRSLLEPAAPASYQAHLMRLWGGR